MAKATKIRQPAEYNKRDNVIVQWLELGEMHDLTLSLAVRDAILLRDDLDGAITQWHAENGHADPSCIIEHPNATHITTIIPRYDGTVSVHLKGAGFDAEVQIGRSELARLAAMLHGAMPDTAYGVCTE